VILRTQETLGPSEMVTPKMRGQRRQANEWGDLASSCFDKLMGSGGEVKLKEEADFYGESLRRGSGRKENGVSSSLNRF